MKTSSDSAGIRLAGARIYLLPVQTRVPLKFGSETLRSVVCARACVKVVTRAGAAAEGWGETPLSVQWVWPSPISYAERFEAMVELLRRIAAAWVQFDACSHPLEIGWAFQEHILPPLLAELNVERGAAEPLPWLAALLCCSVLDQAVHDAFGNAVGLGIYETYRPPFLSRDLSFFLTPAEGSGVRFEGKYPADFLSSNPPQRLRAWHLVGGLDALDPNDLTGEEPKDSYPVLLGDWIKRDGLKCLKIKLRGNDAAWDWHRINRVAQIAIESDCEWLSLDFNCTVREPAYVCEILDRLRDESSRIYGMILYVEQPFPYDLEHHRIPAHSVSSRKPLFLDESAHDWRVIRLGRELGWNGVALKTCKTQTQAVLSACWARAHGMTLMVQDLTNPMLAQIPHVQLAARVGTIMGVETNGMQFYPDASLPEAAVHPGLYRRVDGTLDLSSIQGSGFGLRISEIQRSLPAPAFSFD